MPRPKSPPRYEFHKSTGQAYTRIGGKCIYLGKHGSAESHAKFSCLLSQCIVPFKLDPPPYLCSDGCTGRLPAVEN